MNTLETDRFVCRHCEKVILYERPLFCPYCGEKIDPVDGLEEQDGEVKVYRFSGIAPALVWLLTIWMILVIPAAFLFGRSGFAWLSLLFVVATIFLVLLSLFVTSKK